MPFLRIQSASDEFLVVLGNVSALRFLEEVIALVHFDAERVQRRHHLGRVCDDGFFRIGQLRQVMPLNVVEERQFHFFGIDEYEFQLRWVLPVKQAHQHRIQSHRFTLTGCTRHEEVGHFGQIKYVRLIGDGLADGNGQRSV